MAVTVDTVNLGTVTTTGAKCKARLPSATSATLRLSLSSDLSSPSDFAGSEGNDEVWSFAATGLTAGTTYYGDLLIDEGSGAELAGLSIQFKTALSAAGQVVLAFAGDVLTSSTAITMRQMLRHRPFATVWLGDWGYPDINSAVYLDKHRQHFSDMLGAGPMRDLAMNAVLAVTPGDHNLAGNFSEGDYAGMSAMQQAWREHLAQDMEESTGSMHFAFSPAPHVKVIVLDLYADLDTGVSGQILSETQWTFLEAELLGDHDINVICFDTPYMAGGYWSDGDLTAELARFADAITAARADGKTNLVFHADTHMVAIDDGTNSQFDSGETDPGPVVVAAAPADQSVSDKGGTWSEGDYLVHRHQYVVLTIEADGTYNIVGYAAGAEDAVLVAYPTAVTTEHALQDDFQGADTDPWDANWTATYEVGSTGRVVNIENTAGNPMRGRTRSSSGASRQWRIVRTDKSFRSVEILHDGWNQDSATPFWNVMGPATDAAPTTRYEVKPDITNDLLEIYPREGGTLGTVIASVAKTLVVGTNYIIRFQVIYGASAVTLRAKMWARDSAEPDSWDIDTTDTTAALADVTGKIGLLYRNNSTDSNDAYVKVFTAWDLEDATLQALTVSEGSLSPAFSPGTTEYAVSVANAVTSIDLTPTLAMSKASMTVDGNAAVSQEPATVNLDVGANAIDIVVTAGDGSTTETYTVTVTRAAATSPHAAAAGMMMMGAG